jgi:DNA-directed RNA polymerase specialized sigma24 family protein
MCFFEGLSYREAGAATGTNASSVCRAIQRSMRKLRQAAKEGDIRMPARGRTRP